MQGCDFDIILTGYAFYVIACPEEELYHGPVIFLCFIGSG